MPSPVGIAATSATIAAWAFGRLAYRRYREDRERTFLLAHEMQDPRTPAELWLARAERRLLLVVGPTALVVAAVTGLAALLKAVVD